jgi:hypothetical protein
MSADRPKNPPERAAAGDEVEVGPVSVEKWNMVRIELSKEQQDAVEELVGERRTYLNLVVERLVDLADLVAN